ncbi:MAG: CoA transferase, partial [Dehalococcoidia bacterium]
NTSKQALTLDFDSPEDRTDLTALLELADAVIASAAPGPLRPVSEGLAGEGLVRTLISPFGLDGPYARYRSNVFTDDALGGHMALSGEPDREPLRRAGLHTHLQAGMHAFIGTLAALLARERTGRGQTVEISHLEGMASLHQHTTTMWTHGRHIIRREGNAQPGPWHPAGVYPCKDGSVFLCHSTGAKLIPFLEVLGLGHLLEDPRFATDGARGAHKKEFDAALIPRLQELTVAEIMELGRAVFSPLGPVPTMLEVLEDEQFAARGFWHEIADDPPLKVARGPFLIDGHEPAPSPPPLSASTTTAGETLAAWRRDAARETRNAERHTRSGPLAGLRVLDLTRVWAGPLAGRILADLGADVIHVESPWNRGLQAVDPGLVAISHLFPENEAGERPWNRVGGFNKLARNKRSVTLNLQREAGRSLFARLVAAADVVLENFSPRVMPGLGFDFESLKGLNPSIIYTALSGYGATGPGRDRVALGPVIEAVVGLTQLMGYRDTGPYRSGVAWADPMSGLSAVAGTLVALWDREAPGGEAQHVELAMSEAMAVFAGEELLAAHVRGTNAPRLGNRDPHDAPQGVYRCLGDDRWVAISVTGDEEWRALCDVAGLDTSLAALDLPARHARHDELDAAIGAWTAGLTPQAAMERLPARGVIAARVSDARDLCEDPQLEARGWWAEHDHVDAGRRGYPGLPIRLSETPATYRLPPPGLGEHNDAVYGGLLGLTKDELAALREKRVIADLPPASLEESG